MTFKEFFASVGAAIGRPLFQWRLHKRDGLHHRHSLRSPHQSADWFAMTVEIRKLMHWSADSPRPSLRSATPLINARGKFPLSAAKAPCFGACFSSYIAVPHPSRLSPGHLPPGGRFCGGYRQTNVIAKEHSDCGNPFSFTAKTIPSGRREVTILDALAHALSAGIARKKPPARLGWGFFEITASPQGR